MGEEEYVRGIKLIDVYECPTTGRHSRTFNVEYRADFKAVPQKRAIALHESPGIG